MALIEGVGDEVTLLFGSLLLLAVMLLAWISTRTAEPPEHLFTTGPAPSPGHAHTDTPAPPAEAEAPPTEATAASNEADAAAGADGADGGDGGERNMVLRIKFLNDTETTAQVKPQDTIGYIKRTYFSGREQQVRLIYQGQLLQDDGQTLASLNLAHNCVLHCHISAAAAAGGAGGRGAAGGPRPADPVQVALNVGSLMVPVLVLMLSVLWYCQIQYRQFFTAPATASLVGVTIFLSLVAFGVYRR